MLPGYLKGQQPLSADGRNICSGENPSNLSRFLLKQTILLVETFGLLCAGQQRRTVHALSGVDRAHDEPLQRIGAFHLPRIS